MKKKKIQNFFYISGIIFLCSEFFNVGLMTNNSFPTFGETGPS